MVPLFDLRRSANSLAHADLERRLRADERCPALLDILNSTDDRLKAQIRELRPRAALGRVS